MCIFKVTVTRPPPPPAQAFSVMSMVPYACYLKVDRLRGEKGGGGLCNLLFYKKISRAICCKGEKVMLLFSQSLQVGIKIIRYRERQWWSSIYKLLPVLACRARGPGFDSRSCHFYISAIWYLIFHASRSRID